jgi:hypothetical protein
VDLDAWNQGCAILPLLERIEVLDAAATGSYALGEARSHVLVFVQHGRVCWAVSRSMRGRLTDLLVEQGGRRVGREAFEGAYLDCKALRRPLGELLVERGLVTVDELRSALRAHTCEALASAEAAQYARLRFTAHDAPTYDARFTFSPLELLLGVARALSPACVSRAEQALAAVLPEGTAGLAYARRGGGPPLAAAGLESLAGLGVRDMVELGAFLQGAWDVAGALAAGPQFVSFTRADRAACLAWVDGALILVAACREPSEAAHVAALRTRAVQQRRRVDRAGRGEG